MLSKMRRPSLMAKRIESKLSSVDAMNGESLTTDNAIALTSEDELRSIFSDIRSLHTHGNTNRGELQRGSVVHAIAGHSSIFSPSPSSQNHSDLRLRIASGNDERQLWQSVNFLISELVELSGGHDSAGWVIRCNDLDFPSNGASGGGVIACQPNWFQKVNATLQMLGFRKTHMWTVMLASLQARTA